MNPLSTSRLSSIVSWHLDIALILIALVGLSLGLLGVADPFWRCRCSFSRKIAADKLQLGFASLVIMIGVGMALRAGFGH